MNVRRESTGDFLVAGFSYSAQDFGLEPFFSGGIAAGTRFQGTAAA
jgi:hypothetical protein